ncbi:organic solute transporter subunit alpha-like [Pollicipes pollicipes]|uniref:organic solute transporter subunit alpha-like n=1 Tax=Pollicipes pollicipes TaxID=41117 RepID=UPI001884C2C6|nr:organic solute transporter subunit alpha-like [Pollicipes pollicipes]
MEADGTGGHIGSANLSDVRVAAATFHAGVGGAASFQDLETIANVSSSGGPPDNSTSLAVHCTSAPGIPSTAQVLADLGPYLITVWVLVGLAVLLLCGLLVRTAVLVGRRAPQHWYSNIIWVNSTYAFMCLTALGSLVVPSSDAFLSAIGVIYMGISLSKLVDLCVLYFDGEATLLATVGEAHVPLASPPVCCCCWRCCPRVALKKSSLRMVTLLTHQVPYSQAACFIISLYLYTAGVYGGGQAPNARDEMSAELPGGELDQRTSVADRVSVCLTVFNTTSFMAGMYGLIMFEKMTRGHLPDYHYQTKCMLMKFTLVITKLQELIFNICIKNGAVSCTDSMTPEVYGAFLRNIAVAAEMTVFGLLTHRTYLDGRQYRGVAKEADAEASTQRALTPQLRPLTGMEEAGSK